MPFFRFPRPRRAHVAAAVALPLAMAGCKLDKFVGAVDPDIIDPSFVSNAQGAEAQRLGTLARFNTMTTGSESMFLYGGLLADEFATGDTFIERQQVDQRSLAPQNGNLITAFRALHRPRVGAQQVREALTAFDPTGAQWRLGEMFFVEAYAINMLAENFCSGVALSTVRGGREEVYGAPLSTDSLYAVAIAKIDSGLATVPTTAATATAANEVRVRNSLATLRGRVRVNQGNWADVITSVASVPTTFVWLQEQSLTTRTPHMWSFINNQRRYSVANREGTNGLDFASAADPRVPTCIFNQTACTTLGFNQRRPFDASNTAVPDQIYQLVQATDGSSSPVVSGLQARLYEAEARARLGQYATAGTGSLAILNTLRASPPTYVLSGGRTVTPLPALAAAADAAGQRSQIFREKAFWLYGLGHRLGDLRRLVRQYGLPQDQVFPVGQWQARGVNYQSDVNFPIPTSEANNPLQPSTDGIPQCIDRNA
jgi:hypothetical protein